MINEALAPPPSATGLAVWLRKHFFATWYDTMFSLVFAVLIYLAL